MKTFVTKFIVFALSLVLLQSANAQINSQAEMGTARLGENAPFIGMNFGLDYFSNFHQKESAESESNMNGSAGLTFNFNDFQMTVGMSYTKELQDLREEQLNDATLIISGFNKEISKSVSISASAIGVIALSEASVKGNSFQGGVTIPLVVAYRPESVDWMTTFVFVSGTKNSHEFETNASGESNPSLTGVAGVGIKVSFTDSLNWSTQYRIAQSQSYGGEVFAPVSGYQTYLTYTISSNMSLSLGLITQVALYSDQSKLQPAERLFASSDSLLTSGIAFTF